MFIYTTEGQLRLINKSCLFIHNFIMKHSRNMNNTLNVNLGSQHKILSLFFLTQPSPLEAEVNQRPTSRGNASAKVSNIFGRDEYLCLLYELFLKLRSNTTGILSNLCKVNHAAVVQRQMNIQVGGSQLPSLERLFTNISSPYSVVKNTQTLTVLSPSKTNRIF